MSHRENWIGSHNTACTRTLATLSESGMMADITTIYQRDEGWILSLEWDEVPADNFIAEVALNCQEYGLTLLP